MKTKAKKSLFNVVVFYGVYAVGKYTVAKEFHKQTGYKFFHNHHTHDLARELFDRGTINMDRLIENIRLEVFKEIAKAKINVVTTHAYWDGFVSRTGMSDPMFVKKIESIVRKSGGNIYFIHLSADNSALMKRVSGKSRHKFKKLTDPKVMKEILKEERDWSKSAPVKNNIQINNTHLSPKQVVKKVRELIND